nr:zinc finger, CCHC-type, retrotransposon Gag domain protein [Tanacetum cinerariifolium]
MIRRKKPLRSKTADTLFHILSFCYKYQLSDRGDTDIGPITKDDVPLDCTDILRNDLLCQEDTTMDETRVVLDTQEDGLLEEQPKLAEPDHNIVGETTILCHNVDTDPSVSFDVNDQNNLMDLMMSSSPSLPTDKDAEEGEISKDFMDFTPKDSIGIKSKLENDNNLILLSTVVVENVGKAMTGIVNKSTRNLMDYSEIVIHRNSREPTKQATAVIGSDSSLRRSRRVLAFESNLKNNKTRNQDLVNPLKGWILSTVFLKFSLQRSSTQEERVYKKAKKLVDLTTCPENINSVGEHHEDAFRKVVDASVNKDAAIEKKKKRVVTQESKAKKKSMNNPKDKSWIKHGSINVISDDDDDEEQDDVTLLNNKDHLVIQPVHKGLAENELRTKDRIGVHKVEKQVNKDVVVVEKEDFSDCLSEFSGVCEPISSLRWILEIENIFKAIKCDDGDKVVYAVSKLRLEAKLWWDIVKDKCGPTKMTWSRFKEVFKDKFCPISLVKEYTAHFVGMSRVAEHLVATEERKIDGGFEENNDTKRKRGRSGENSNNENNKTGKKKFRPPLKMLVPIWKALCAAADCKESYDHI